MYNKALSVVPAPSESSGDTVTQPPLERALQCLRYLPPGDQVYGEEEIRDNKSDSHFLLSRE